LTFEIQYTTISSNPSLGFDIFKKFDNISFILLPLLLTSSPKGRRDERGKKENS